MLKFTPYQFTRVNLSLIRIIQKEAKMLKKVIILSLCIMSCLLLATNNKANNIKTNSPFPRLENLAIGKAVTFNTPLNYPDTKDNDDAKQLVDGVLASKTPMWYDKATVGWIGPNRIEFSIDLGSVQPIRGVALHMAAGQAGVEWPTGVQIFVSDTGNKFNLAGDLTELLTKNLPKKGYAACWLATDKLETHGRFIKFVCSPADLGAGSYIFLDEVEVYRGNDDWLKRALSVTDAPAQWQAVWREIKWKDNAGAIPEKERPSRVLLIDGESINGGGNIPLQQTVLDNGGMNFTFKGEASKPRSMFWIGKLEKPISTEKCRYALLTFRATGIRRTYDVYPMVSLQGVNDQTADNEIALLEANMAPNDGRSHTLVKPLPDGFTLQQIKVALVSEDDAPRLVLEKLELCNTVPEVFNQEITTGQPKPGFVPVKLNNALRTDVIKDGDVGNEPNQLLNGTLSDWYEKALSTHKMVLDGVRDLKGGTITVSGVPFVISSENNNLALMPESKPSTEQVKFLRQQVSKCFLGPDSRHDTLSIDVDTKASEAFLLLALSVPPVQRRGGIPNAPFSLDDIECISVELAYDKGNNEIAFPYSLADKGCFVPAREIGAYAVAIDNTRQLKKITLHNRQFGPNYALAGLTFNTTAKALVPELTTFASPARTRQNTDPAFKPVTVEHKGKRLTFSNRWYECSLNLTDGFVIDRMVNRWNESAKIQLAPSSGLRVRVGDKIYTGRCFMAEVVKMTKTTAELRLISANPELPLEIKVSIVANDSPELSFAVQAVNQGKKTLAAEFCLPALCGLSLGNLPRTSIFFPQYRTVNTANNIALRAPYGPEFALQFMDVYNSQDGIGLMVRSDNKEQRMVNYALRKDESGVAGGVCFPSEYNQLEPGESCTYPTISLLTHSGDWHTALNSYRDWVRSWYKPFKTQKKDFFLNAWDVNCYRPSEKISWLDSRFPAIITPDRKEFLLDETFAFEKEYLGHVSDIIHFFNWTHNDRKDRNEYGIFGTPLAYEQVGGLEFFRRGIAEIQGKWKTPVSLYTIFDRLRISALPDKQLAKDVTATSWYQQLDNDPSAVVRASGTVDGIIYPKIGYDRWVDFFVSDIAKMQRDTGCKLVYIDVFPFFSHLGKGYNGITPREADVKILKRMRESLPADVVLWTEYCFTDVASQYADGALVYYFLELNETFARRYNNSDHGSDLFMEMPLNTLRYVLPRYKTIGLPGYIEASNKPSQVDALFVNGEAIQEDTWRLHHSRIRTKLNRAYVVKHEYNDCFNSENPVPQVDTEASGIVANLFPGAKRKLWTLYNSRPKTYSGTVLAIPHQTGAKYRDAWNNKELQPVIENGVAKISLSIDPQMVAAVVQEVP